VSKKGGQEVGAVESEDGLRYQPDYAVPPGESLAEILEDRGMSQAELARRTGISAKHINLILKGTAPISPDSALKLERVVGVPARVWNALEANYQGHISRLEESRGLEEQVGWASKELIKDLIKRGHIHRVSNQVDQLREVLRFFGVASVAAWNAIWDQPAATAAYRLAKLEGDPVALAAWMRIGELRAADADTAPFDRARLRDVLEDARALTVEADPRVWRPLLEQLCRSVGVVVIIEKELPRARVNGIARWITPSKALIQLSLRYLRDDIFWFTFFHEAAHLLLHGKRSGPREVPPTHIDPTPYIDPDLPTFIDMPSSGGQREDEANEFAANLLIPPGRTTGLLSIASLDDVRRVAAELGISPGIVVGRLHHDGIKPFSWGSALFTRYKFSENA
jgi:HTH-type transcriptional regulator/antitoxin HigA